MKKTYKMLIKYDGTRYNGWQRQSSTANTIQGKLEAVLSRMAEEEITVDGSGRTDAGVHALGQTASFRMDTQFSPEQIRDYLNQYLPEDIAVCKVSEAADRFHARLSVVRKTYCYRVYVGTDKPVFDRRYVYELEEIPDLQAMRMAAECLVGTHDFCSFCGNRRMKKSTVRTIKQIRIEPEGDEIHFIYTGNGFLQNMVRILTGTLLEIGCGRMEWQQMKRILEYCDRSKAGPMAPAKGLTLVSVEYH